MDKEIRQTAHYHLPGLFEFYEFYELFLPLFHAHPEYFYPWCDIGSIYGAPSDCLWGGGRISSAKVCAQKVLSLMQKYGISSRLTLSNSLLERRHLDDEYCNELCRLFSKTEIVHNGVIVTSDLLKDYLKEKYPNLYLVSSTTKVLMDFNDFVKETEDDEFDYVVPDFRLNKAFEKLEGLPQKQKDKTEFLCNECCYVGCKERKRCYENVSRQILDENVPDFVCTAPYGDEGYRFSRAMQNPCFISIEDIQNIYLPMGFSNFKIEGRNLGSALILEILLYYMVKPEYQLNVREAIYLDSMLDLF